jgi:hypothetical protein
MSKLIAALRNFANAPRRQSHIGTRYRNLTDLPYVCEGCYVTSTHLRHGALKRFVCLYGSVWFASILKHIMTKKFQKYFNKEIMSLKETHHSFVERLLHCV